MLEGTEGGPVDESTMDEGTADEGTATDGADVINSGNAEVE